LNRSEPDFHDVTDRAGEVLAIVPKERTAAWLERYGQRDNISGEVEDTYSGRRDPMRDDYDALAQAVTAAGFFTNGVEEQGTWDRTCVCSKRHPSGFLTGNSFWVSRLAGRWYLGTWGGLLYCLPDETRLAELCVSWLSRVPDDLRSDFDDRLKAEFGLVPVAEDAFNRQL